MSTTTEYRVTGMTCAHCEKAIRDEVSRVSGITHIEVNARAGVLTVSSEQAVEDAAVIEAVREAGYSVVGS
ncbi:MAG TPA: heavy-metal-associated domain-containing protein [Candidatus Agrococcus pullicola]|uniref:Heavy-metal-associated domain-containing protein n=1 Tax=Candidatus Agrococcus pullicola TaxID=2838429 RepID=A0A9D2CB35_9MICO|nr:heavy-metal-associated domain-containing protein [Candidatus Agrococcus pullicola]